jgi:hypothetical protein
LLIFVRKQVSCVIVLIIIFVAILIIIIGILVARRVVIRGCIVRIFLICAIINTAVIGRIGRFRRNCGGTVGWFFIDNFIVWDVN